MTVFDQRVAGARKRARPRTDNEQPSNGHDVGRLHDDAITVLRNRAAQAWNRDAAGHERSAVCHPSTRNIDADALCVCAASREWPARRKDHGSWCGSPPDGRDADPPTVGPVG